MLEEVRFSAQIGVQDGLLEACWDCGVGYGAELNDVVWSDESSHWTCLYDLLALSYMIVVTTLTGLELATSLIDDRVIWLDLPKLVMMKGKR
jgi:hypothetical protein